ncbi:hypothetical protein MferCBS31731_001449 [Microsporum ferrugineum]
MHIPRLLFPLLTAFSTVQSAVIHSIRQSNGLSVVAAEVASMGRTLGCDILSKQLPKRGQPPELPVPDLGLRLKYITLGVGTQNYTCANDVTKPVPVGAVATLYDASCLASLNTRAMHIINAISLHSSKALATWVLEKLLKTTVLGHHYFTGGKPFFDLSTHGGSDRAYVSVAANVPAPNSHDVPWLRLDTTEGSGIKVCSL